MNKITQSKRKSVRFNGCLLASAVLFGTVLSSFAQTTFNYTGAVQTYTVPAGATQITVDVQGAQGGDGVNASVGAYGGRVQATLAVNPGDVLDVLVGGAGGNCETCASGGFNGGGGTNAMVGGNQAAGTGGGASDIRVTPYALANRIVVGGGGGGGGYTGAAANGGVGGGLIGGTGATWNGYQGGTGGTQSAGGIGGNGSSNGQPNAVDGTFGFGGAGQGWSGGGGGAGGGYYGGGGGFIGGGGGGSNYADAGATSVLHTAGYRAGNGLVIITPIVSGPTISSFTPNSGCPNSTSVVITGTNFTGITAVLFGGTNALSFTVNSSTQITATVGVGTTGTIQVVGSTTATSIGTFTVNALPAAPTAVTATPASICAGSTSNLNATSAGNTINWWDAVTGGTLLTNVASGTNYSVMPSATTTYFAESQNAVSGGSGSQTFNYTGAVQTFTVPAGVISLTIDSRGAQGGAATNPSVGPGANGGRVQATISVTPGDVLNINVGGMGVDGTTGSGGAGGFNGGGAGALYAGSYAGGGGGGASDIRVSPYTLNDRLVVAGGGGGGAYNYSTAGADRGGMGGGTIGEGGYSGSVLLGNGYAGNGGTQSAGGAAGNYTSYCIASDGVLGVGGAGGPCNNSGGGGGGGFYGGGGGVWAGGGGGSSFPAGATHTQGYQTGNGQVIISWVSTILGCASSTRTSVDVIVTPLPVITSSSATASSICVGDSSNLNAVSLGNTINWWNAALGGTLLSSVPSGTDYSVSPTSTTTYYAEGVTPSSASSILNGTVAANSSGGTYTLGYTFTPSSTLTVTGVRRYFGTKISVWDNAGTLLMTQACSGTDGVWSTTPCTPLVLNAGSTYYIGAWTNGGAYYWDFPSYPYVLSAGTIGYGQYASTDSWPSISDLGMFYVDLEFSGGTGGCTSVSRTAVTVTVNQLPTVSANASATTICAGDAETLTGSGAVSYVWDNSVTDGVTFNPTSTVTYNVTGTDGNGCMNTASVLVNVNQLPAVSANASSTSICMGDAETLTGSGAVSYVWDNSVTDGVSFNPTSTVTYNVTGTDGNGCMNTASVLVNVNQLPTVSANASSTSICMGDAETLTGGGAVSYVWDNNVTDGVSFNPTSTVTYNVTGTDGNGCMNTASVLVNVNTLPTVTYTETTLFSCVNWAPFSLATGTPVGGVYSGIGVAGTNFDPAAAGSGTANVTYTYTDGNGCAGSASSALTVDACTGISTLTASTAIAVYPNPSNGVYNITISEPTQVTVYNALGQVVLIQEVNANTTQIDLSKMMNGIYTLNAVTANHQQTIRLIKN